MGPLSDDLLVEAAAQLLTGGLVAFPTETVYGLGARADDPAAVAGIYRAKGRPSNNPLIVHVTSLDAAASFAEICPLAQQLAAAFWPGPLTLVLPALMPSPLASAVRAGNPSIAVRVPAHPIARHLLAATGVPIAAPSANRSGRVSPTRASHVAEEFGAEVLVLDGGPTEAGLESTILDLTSAIPRLLRPGTITMQQLNQVTGTIEVITTPQANPTAPGQLASHYAPSKPVLLNQVMPPNGAVHIGFGEVMGDLSLSITGDLAEAAQSLFAVLRTADQHAEPMIAVAPIPNQGIGLAINDRLTRAAAPRH